MPINSRTKGKVAELEVAELLRSHGFEARRGQQFSGGLNSPDVVSDLGLHVEVKRVESFNLYSAVDQCNRDCKNESYAIFHRKNKKNWVTILNSDTFLKLMRELHTLREREKVVLSTRIVMGEAIKPLDHYEREGEAGRPVRPTE